MLKWHCTLLILSFITVATCTPQLVIIWEGHNGPIPHTITDTVGSHLSLTCTVKGIDDQGGSVLWSRRTSELWFENENDLLELANLGVKEILSPKLAAPGAILNLQPVKLAHRGTYFCMNLENRLFKIVRIKVKEVTCTSDRFKCDNGEKCIDQHETCDKKYHCTDHSDEKWELCHGDTCKGSIPCGDHCIPTKWCCDIRSDSDCFIMVRNSCCPPLPYGGHSNNYHVEDNHKNDDEDTGSDYPNSTHKIVLFITSAFVVVIMCLVIYFGIKKYSSNQEIHSTDNQNGMPMPSIIRTDDNDNSMILTTLMNANMNSSREYLDLPPTYDDSTRNSPRSSYHSSLEDVATDPVTTDCLPSYDEALANLTSSPSDPPLPPNAAASSAAFLGVPTVVTQQPPARDQTISRE